MGILYAPILILRFQTSSRLHFSAHSTTRKLRVLVSEIPLKFLKNIDESTYGTYEYVSGS